MQQQYSLEDNTQSVSFSMSRPDHLEEFEANFGPLLQGTIDALTLEESSKDDSEDGPKPTGLEEIRKIYQAEEKLKECRKVSREMVDAARNDLRAISRTYEQQRLSATRPAGLPSAADHEARMAAGHFDRLAKMKQNGELEKQLYRMQSELVKLNQELKEEESDAFEVSELNGEVLRIKLYRDFGFTPMEENGAITKVLVRSRKSLYARTVQLDTTPSNPDFYWSNFLWDSLSL